MLFDITPKEDRKDFFDRDREIEELKKLKTPIMLVLGLRRTGKSSLIKIALKEIGLPSFYLDLRKFEEKDYISYKDFILEFQAEVNKLIRRFPRLLDLLKRIRGVSILGNEVKFSWKGEERLRFSSLLDALEEGVDEKVVIALDEVQELAKLRGANLLSSLAYAYDNLKKVKIILSGSEMGLLYSFLRVDDSNSPLYGRAFSTIELKPFSRQEAIEFLRKGFQEANIDFRDYDVVYEKIGGIPGWLTYFGFVYIESKRLEDSIKLTLNYAKKLILKEFENFLRTREVAKKRYYLVMKTLSNCARWSEVKRALEFEEGREISDSEIYNYLNQLIKHSWIVKEGERYCPSEPLIAYSFKEEGS